MEQSRQIIRKDSKDDISTSSSPKRKTLEITNMYPTKLSETGVVSGDEKNKLISQYFGKGMKDLLSQEMNEGTMQDTLKDEIDKVMAKSDHMQEDISSKTHEANEKTTIYLSEKVKKEIMNTITPNYNEYGKFYDSDSYEPSSIEYAVSKAPNEDIVSKLLDQALELHSECPDLYTLIGERLIHFGQYKKALTAFEKALAYKKAQKHDSIDLGELHGRIGNCLSGLAIESESLGSPEQAMHFHQQALISYNKSIEAFPESAEAYNCKGSALNELHRHEESLEAYNEAIKRNSERAPFYNNRGNVYSDLGWTEEALADYNTAIDIDPSEGEYHFNKACALSKLEWHGDALTALEEAEKHGYEDPDLYFEKGATLKELNRSKEALTVLKEAEKHGYKDPDLYSLLEQIEKTHDVTPQLSQTGDHPFYSFQDQLESSLEESLHRSFQTDSQSQTQLEAPITITVDPPRGNTLLLKDSFDTRSDLLTISSLKSVESLQSIISFASDIAYKTLEDLQHVRFCSLEAQQAYLDTKQFFTEGSVSSHPRNNLERQIQEAQTQRENFENILQKYKEEQKRREQNIQEIHEDLENLLQTSQQEQDQNYPSPDTPSSTNMKKAISRYQKNLQEAKEGIETYSSLVNTATERHRLLQGALQDTISLEALERRANTTREQARIDKTITENLAKQTQNLVQRLERLGVHWKHLASFFDLEDGTESYGWKTQIAPTNPHFSSPSDHRPRTPWMEQRIQKYTQQIYKAEEVEKEIQSIIQESYSFEKPSPPKKNTPFYEERMEDYKHNIINWQKPTEEDIQELYNSLQSDFLEGAAHEIAESLFHVVDQIKGKVSTCRRLTKEFQTFAQCRQEALDLDPIAVLHRIPTLKESIHSKRVQAESCAEKIITFENEQRRLYPLFFEKKTPSHKEENIIVMDNESEELNELMISDLSSTKKEPHLE